MSFLFWSGMITVKMPDRMAASVFFPQAAHRHDLAAERDFPGHGQIRGHGPPGQGGNERRGHGHSGRRPLLGHGPGRHVNVDIHFLVELFRQVQVIGPGTGEGQGRLRAFLHHLAQLPRQGQVSLARHGAGFNIHDLPAAFRPGQARGHPDLALVAAGFRDEFGYAHVPLQVARGKPKRRLVALGEPAGHLAAQRSQMPLQVAQSGFLGVFGNDPQNGLVGDRQRVRRQAVFLDLTGDQKPPGNGHLFVLRVPGQPDDFHAVFQGLRDGVDQVGRGDEHHPGQVERQVDVVIGKGVVLLGVQHLEQGRGRVPPESRPRSCPPHPS